MEMPTQEKIENAKQDLSILDRASASAMLSRQDHAAVVQAVQGLLQFITESEQKSGKPEN